MTIRRTHVLAGSILSAVAVWSIATAFAATRVIYVDKDARSGGTGRNWTEAYRSLDEAFVAARSGDQVWVAEGIYSPTTGRDRSVSFDVPAGVAVYGGFTGTERDLDERDWAANRTVLSGDIGQPGEMRDNSYHVVVAHEAVVVDGFTIRDGYSINAPPDGGRGPSGRSGPPPMSGPPSGPPPGAGGPVHVTPEMLLESLQPGFGAGMAAFKVDTLTVRNVVFENNSAMAGGAMYNLPNISSMADIEGHRSNVRVVGVKFLHNYAEKRGGAVIDNLGASPMFVDTVFQDNECADKGGAVYDDFRSSPQFYNVLFSGNKAFRGAAMGNDGGSNPILVNATFVHNEAQDVGAGLYQGTGGSPNEPTVVASIVWGNTADEGPGNVYDWHHSTVHFVRSAVEGGGGGVDVEPEFQDPHAKNYALAAGSKLAELGVGYDPNRSGVSLVGSVKSMAGPPTDENASVPAWKPTGVTKGAVYVTQNGAGKRDGSSWGDAFGSLQSAIDRASEKHAQVWVAAGTYLPTGADRSASFRLADGVQIYGGFAGTERNADERDPRQHTTVLSGDLGRKGELSDNAFHVLEGANGVVLDGVTIQDGNANGALYDGRGGGLVSYEENTRTLPGRTGEGFTDVVLHDVTFRNNHAKEGGAFYAFGTSSLGFDRVRFEDNAADYGGALVLRVDIDASFERTSFVGNRSTWQGGAVYLDYGVRPTFVECEFTANQAGSHGGAAYLTTRASQVEETTVTFDGCTFDENHSGGRGGAISNFDQGKLEVVRSSFDGNSAELGGGAIATDRESMTELSQASVGTNRGGTGEPDLATDKTSRFSLR